MWKGKRGTIEERFWRHVLPEPNSGCWLWIGAVRAGYGQFGVENQRVRSAHVVAWELYRGSIPKGLCLDHLCRVRCCVNPDHLEIVTNKVNILRGIGTSAVNARKTRCRNGHEFIAENTYYYKGHRKCKLCVNEYVKSYRKIKRGGDSGIL